jgi:hypothetical protein
VSGQKDAKGKLFHNEIIKTAETKGSGWVDYMFPKPGQTEPSQKWTFVKKVTIDGAAGLVASGFYGIVIELSDDRCPLIPQKRTPHR